METEKIDVPKFDEHECIGFVIPKDNLPCWHLVYRENGSYFFRNSDSSHDAHKICYRKIKPHRIVFESTGEKRSPRDGEWIKTHDGNYVKAEPRIIYGLAEIYRIVEE